MKSKYNPNAYVVKVSTPQGTKLGYFNNSDIITGTDDSPLCVMKDFSSKCSYFSEVLIDVVRKERFEVGGQLCHEGLCYFVLEVDEKDVDVESEKVYSYIVGR